MNKLRKIQQDMHCPKDQTNTFGGYKYRSCEDILKAVKPLLATHDCTLVIYDELQECAGWVFVVALATLFDADGTILAQTRAAARHEAEKKGMDGSQISGAASSYARKYALNGLFLIDDARDSDATNTHGKPHPAVGLSRADGERIAKARTAANLSQDDVRAIASRAPFSCQDFPHDLIPKHVDALIDRINQAGKDNENA